jgi:hypothetical protein
MELRAGWRLYPLIEFREPAGSRRHVSGGLTMKSKVMSLDEPRTPRTGKTSARANAYRNGASQVSYSGQGRISPWLPIGLGAITALLVLRAMSEHDKRSTTQRWLDTTHRRASRWLPEVRDTVEDFGHRAASYIPEQSSVRDWMHDVLPSRRSLSDLFSKGSDWLPNTGVSKRQLLANFDWSNPPRWLRNVDLSSESKRRAFLKDLRRYGTRTRDDFLSSIGWR